MKKCSKCGVEKAFGEFHKEEIDGEGLAYFCKECVKQYGQERRKKYKQYWSTHDPYSNPSLKQCPSCKEDLERKSFARCMSAKDGLEFGCRHCRGNIKRGTHIKRDSKAIMYQLQGGCCGICKRAFVNDKLVIDHLHGTTVSRGLLCRPCNSAIGLLLDSSENCLRAAEYIAGNREKLLSQYNLTGTSSSPGVLP